MYREERRARLRFVQESAPESRRRYNADRPLQQGQYWSASLRLTLPRGRALKKSRKAPDDHLSIRSSGALEGQTSLNVPVPGW